MVVEWQKVLNMKTTCYLITREIRKATKHRCKDFKTTNIEYIPKAVYGISFHGYRHRCIVQRLKKNKITEVKLFTADDVTLAVFAPRPLFMCE